MTRAIRWGLLPCSIALMAGCAPGTGMSRLDEMERIRATPGAREGAELAPQVYAQAEEERARARQALQAKDEVGAALHADRASVGYQRALVLARLSRATRELQDAQAALDAASERARGLASQRAQVEAEADSLEKQLLVVREQLLPVASGRADPEREAARKVAARSLLVQARLLCGAARLLTPSLADADDMDRTVTTVEKQLGARGPAPIDAAARARAGCLSLLTKARRVTAGGTNGDALLSDLSSSGGWDPSRDERGVVVTLRNAFRGTSLTSEADRKLQELGRVAAAHPDVGVQAVLHDASAPGPAEVKANAQRIDAVVKALVAGGAASSKVKGEAAGHRAPVVDPSDPKLRARNARLEIVFVVPGG